MKRHVVPHEFHTRGNEEKGILGESLPRCRDRLPIFIEVLKNTAEWYPTLSLKQVEKPGKKLG
jgi:hypothetical protein